MIKKCLNCDKEFEQPEGKREKKFCSDNCRAAFNQKNKSEFVRVPRETWEKMNEPKVNVTDPTGEEKKANYTIDTKEEIHQQKIDEAFDEYRAKERVIEIEKELANPPKNPSIGMRKWQTVRQEELKKLKSQLK